MSEQGLKGEAGTKIFKRGGGAAKKKFKRGTKSKGGT